MAIDFEKKIKKLRDRGKDERNTLRYQKTIAETAKKIIEKDTKLLNYKDYEEITQKTYNTTNKITVLRVKTMMKEEEALTKIDNTLQKVYADNGVPLKKVFSTLKKAIKASEEKNDGKTLLEITKFLAEVHSIMPNKVVGTVTETTYSPGDLETSYDNASNGTKVVKKVVAETSQKPTNGGNDLNSND